MDSASRSLVQECFLNYYTEKFHEVDTPHSFSKREFGVMLFKEKTMVRHKKFATADDLRNFVLAVAPSDIYYSSAFYEQPDLTEMKEKEWIGADLIFDIDADHIPSPCDKIHDEWRCSNCGFAGKGVTPDKCPSCGSERFDVNTWPCTTCLESARSETAKLLEMMTADYGFSNSELRVFFSGHRGYHVQVESKILEKLDGSARKEIVDYVSGLGLDPSLQGFSDKEIKVSFLRDSGWSERIGNEIWRFLSEATKEKLQDIGLKAGIAEIVVKNKNVIVQNLKENKQLRLPKGIGFESWKRIVEMSIAARSAHVDTVVTIDTHRLIRLSGTLNSKTGLKKTEFPTRETGSFDPFKKAVAFQEGSLKVLASHVPQFRIMDQTFGPYEDQKVELPTAAALLLLCRRRAEVVD